MTNKLLKYTGIAATIIGLGSAYYCNNQFNELSRREDLTELYAIRNIINAPGLQYVSTGVREATQKELEERLNILESNPQIREGDKQRHNYLLGFIVSTFIGLTPMVWYSRRRQ